MKFKTLLIGFFIMLSTIVIAQDRNADTFKTKNGTITIQSIFHSSIVITYQNKTIYVDPYGDLKLYEGLNAPDIILITDIHGDHLSKDVLNAIDTSKSIFIIPEAVKEQLSETQKQNSVVLKNGQGIHRHDMFIKAIPMYNLPEEADSKHPKGRGNGYTLSIDDKTIYISGDTEDIVEMRNLQNIDIAFVCMNLPFTMDINQAASAVLEFEPKVVYPYHYRGQGGFSDVASFQNLVNSKNKNIEVRLKNWYPKFD